MTTRATAWLLTRGDDSVRLAIRESRDGVQLVIDGPGAQVSRYDFPPGTAVDSFRIEYAQRLMADGYRLQSVSERRSDSGELPVDTQRRRRGDER